MAAATGENVTAGVCILKVATSTPPCAASQPGTDAMGISGMSLLRVTVLPLVGMCEVTPTPGLSNWKPQAAIALALSPA